MPGLLDGVEFTDLRTIVYDSIRELGSELYVVSEGAAGTVDADFGNVIQRNEVVLARLPYTQKLTANVSDKISMRMKLLMREGPNFTAWQTMNVWIPTLSVERLMPGGEIRREAHLFVIGGVYYQIDSILAIPARNVSGASVLLQCFCTEKSPAEQAGAFYPV